MAEIGNPIGMVIESTPSLVRVEIADHDTFENSKDQLSVGQYVLIAAGNTQYLLATITAARGSHSESASTETKLKFTLDTQPIGTWSNGSDFRRGSKILPAPTEPAYVAPAEVLDAIFASKPEAEFALGTLAIAPDVNVRVDGDKFFGKHVAVVGSTGSGKSCAVASILQRVVGLQEQKNVHLGCQKNSHIVIFDIHSEYEAAFKIDAEQNFTLNSLNVDNLMLPYWLMNAEELEQMFIESNEINSHNQVSQFRHAVVRNKHKHNPGMGRIAFDSPVYFSIEEVVTYLENMNVEVIGKLAGEGKPKLEDGSLVADRDAFYFDALQSFVASSTAKDTKASNGPFHGEFDRLILRLRTRLADARLSFLFYPKKPTGDELVTADFATVARQFTGYLNKSNVSIVDLSGIPFEVLSVVISLISRMIFDFGFHYSKLRQLAGNQSDVPIMLVCEEAHNYVPNSGAAMYGASRKSIERIAKEGRKYGVTLMVVSQRPAEVSDTIFSQCSNFISLRLTNLSDQSYIRGLLPDLTTGLAEQLSNLGQGEFLAVGDALLMPTVGQFPLPNPEPHSRSVDYMTEWRVDWRDVDFDKVVDRWRGNTLSGS